MCRLLSFVLYGSREVFNLKKSWCTGLTRIGSQDRILVNLINCFLSCSRHVVYFKLYKEFSKDLCFPKIFYHTFLYVSIASGASVDPPSQICSSAMLVLPIVGN
jgi:hypothetical protein